MRLLSIHKSQSAFPGIHFPLVEKAESKTADKLETVTSDSCSIVLNNGRYVYSGVLIGEDSIQKEIKISCKFALK